MTATRLRMRDRMASSLRVRNYRLYFWGQTVSVAGTWMQTLALAFLTLDITGSGTDLGIVAGARLLPFVLLGPVGGVIADRAADKRRLLYFTQIAQAVVALIFAALAATHTASMPWLVALSLLVGLVAVPDNPARQSLIPELVPPAEVANAVTLGSVSVNLARVAGAAVGGSLVAFVGVAPAFLINAASFAAVIASLALLDPGRMFPAERAARARGQVRAGLRYVRQTPVLVVPLFMLFITGTLAYEFPVTLPLLARGVFHGGAGVYGAMAAVMAVGSVVGGLVAAARREARRATSLGITSICWGAAILAAAIAPDLPVEFVALFVTGWFTITFNSSVKTTLQLAAEPQMRGRVMALWAIGWTGTTVIGGPIVGWIAEQAGSRWSLVAGGLPTLVLGLAMLPALARIDRRTASAAAPVPAA